MPVPRSVLLPAALSALMVAPAAAQTVAPAPTVRAVTLSTAGLALLSADAALGAVPLRFSVPRAAIDDVLKSLLVADPSGAVATLTMAGPGAFQDAFAALPLTPDQVGDPVLLLRALAGSRVVHIRRGESVAGVVMGVGERACDDGLCPVLNLSTDAGLRSLPLDDAAAVTLSDPADQAALERGLAAWAGARGAQRVDLTLSTDSADTRDGTLTWVQAAPVWRTAWRAVDPGDGTLRLGGWAVVENATGQDWHDVSLTLATGAVRAIDAQLYERRMAARESDMMFEPVSAPFVPAPALRAMSAAVAEIAAAPVVADDGDSFSRFTLQTPVTLAAGQMLSVPFLSETLPDARLTLHTGGSGARHPQIALQIVNPLPLRLPAGVLTLYEDGRGHAGDAMIPELAPGAEETVVFARDTAVEIVEDRGQTEILRQMRLVAGMLEVTEDLERTTTYRIAGAPAAARVLTLDHPRQSDWALVTPGAGERLDAWRWRLDIAAGQRLDFAVTERQPRLRRVAVADIDLGTLAAWQSRSTDPALAARLAVIADLRAGIVAADQRQRALATEIADLEREQGRLVNLIVQLGDSPANTERRARVDAIDRDIVARTEGIARARAEADALRADLAAALAG